MKEPKTIGFAFQEIDLVDAQNIAAAGGGKYSELTFMLTQKLPALEAYNADPNNIPKGFAFGLPGGKEIDDKSKKSLINTVNKKISMRGIHWKISYFGAKKLFVCVPTSSLDLSHSKKGLRYKENIKKKSKLSIEDFVSLAKNIFGYEGDFKHDRASQAIRKAIAMVGVKDLHFKAIHFDNVFSGRKTGVTSYLLNLSTRDASKEITILRQGLKQKGVI